MKKLFLSIVAVGLSLMANAQQTEKQMATLQHGDQTTVYYGPDAFVSAYNAAADTLDVITLSSGEFNVPRQISKSIAVYGVGYENDTTTNTDRTYLNSGLNFSRCLNVHLEGLCFGDLYLNTAPVNDLIVAKCQLRGGVYYTGDCNNNVFKQNVITKRIGNSESINSHPYQPLAKNLLITNCWLGGDKNYDFKFSAASTILVDHCIIREGTNGPFRYTNNISYVTFPANSSSSNNVYIDANNKQIGDDGDWLSLLGNSVFAAEGEDGNYSADKDFALKYPERYIGNDGTEIGLHGGVYAWNKIPCIPRITSCTLDTKDAANGTIRVSIQAEAQTKE